MTQPVFSLVPVSDNVYKLGPVVNLAALLVDGFIQAKHLNDSVDKNATESDSDLSTNEDSVMTSVVTSGISDDVIIISDDEPSQKNVVKKRKRDVVIELHDDDDKPSQKNAVKQQKPDVVIELHDDEDDVIRPNVIQPREIQLRVANAEGEQSSAGSSKCITHHKYPCRECHPHRFCIHGRRKHTCGECGGHNICVHKRYKYNCAVCKPPAKV